MIFLYQVNERSNFFTKLVFKDKKALKIKELLLKYRPNKNMYKKRNSLISTKQC